MPVFNAENYIKQSIESVLNQSEQDFELIIINDGSIDESEEIIKSFSDRRIKYFYQENSGAAAARNKGLDNALGDFIVFQDADDLSVPCRFEILKRQFKSSSIGIVHSDMLTIDEDNSPLGYWQSRNVEKNRVLRFFLKVGTFINGPSMMLRKEVFEDLRYDATLKIGEDTNLILQALKYWESVHVPEPLYFYRKHSNNTTKENDYNTLVLHVQKTIEAHSIKDLIPEIDWKNDLDVDSKSKAYAILSLFLFRRGMAPDGIKWYEHSLQLAQGNESENFVLALGKIINGNLREALKLFYSIRKKDYLLENYIGEILALLGRDDLAYYHFNNALLKKPDYIEPMDNIRSTGAVKSYNLLDTTWLKFNNKN